MRSGRVRTRFSLHPSCAAPPKSLALSCLDCRRVPIAPSSTSTRRSRASSRARTRSGRPGSVIRLPLYMSCAKNGDRPNYLGLGNAAVVDHEAAVLNDLDASLGQLFGDLLV